MRWSDFIWSSNFILRTDLWWHAFKININCCWKLESMEEKKEERSVYSYMLWFNFILGWNYISRCFKLIIVYYHTQKRKKIEFKPRTELNHNIMICTLFITNPVFPTATPSFKKVKAKLNHFCYCLFVCLFVFVVSWNKHIGQNHLISGI